MRLPVSVLGRHEAPFHYGFHETLTPGTLVLVPLRRRVVLGVVWPEEDRAPYEGEVKAIQHVLNLPPLSPQFLAFLKWVASYTLTPLGLVLKMALGFGEKEPHKLTTSAQRLDHEHHPSHLLCLNAHQQEVMDQLRSKLSRSEFQPCVLEGVTGSGKTEVYLSLLQDIKARGGHALILLPEIALNAYWSSRFRRYFGHDPVVWHSDLTPKQKRQIGQSVLQGHIPVVVGTRSALFLPFPKLDLIVVDEEHDASYKQDEGVLYHARDMAVVRAKHEACPILLCSATPSFETRHNIQHRGYHHSILTSRYGDASMPQIALIDLKQYPLRDQNTLSPPLIQAIQNTLARGEQTLLFLNRRGYAPVVFCAQCRQRISCHQCAAGRIYHKRYRMMICHQCGTADPLPEACPLCAAPHTLIPLGIGVERIAEEVRRIFPEARSLIFSSDTASSARKADALLRHIHDHEVDIVIGTQMMAKGHHLPLLTCVGVVHADLGLWTCDFRAMEKTYQLMVQVAGRAGRAERPGQVLVQTEIANHPLMQALAHGAWPLFWAEEERQRLMWHWPPFGRLVALILSSPHEDKVRACCQHLSRTQPDHEEGLQILGPIPAPLSMVRGRYRWRFLIKAPRSYRVHALLKSWVEPAMRHHPQIKGQIDLDPYTFL